MGERALGERIQSVEHLRGLAASAVMWFHFTQGNPNFLSDGLLKASGAYGYLGVEIFFVISGFVIPYAMAGRSYRLADGTGFFLRRIVRLEPPYLATVVLCLLLVALGSMTPWFRGEPPTTALIGTALLHPAYLVPWFDVEWLNPVFWTLAIEFQYYLLILFAAPALLSNSRRLNRVFLGSTAALSISTADERLVLPFLPLFALGFLAFMSLRGRMVPAESIAWLSLFALLGLHNFDGPIVIAGLFGAVAILIPWPASLPALSFLGAASYSIYLVHVPVGGRVINLATRLPDHPVVHAGTLALATATTLLAAYLLLRYIEKPSVRAAKRFGAPKLRLNNTIGIGKEAFSE
jgi:peptidoglycan/LPS O-acetylase OafA/YrhL